MNRLKLLLPTFLLILSACASLAPAAIQDQASPTLSLTAAATDSILLPTDPPVTETAELATRTPLPEPQPTNTVEQTKPSPLATESPQPTEKPLSTEQDIGAVLASVIPPERDDLRLAVAYRGLSDVDLEDAPLEIENLVPGTRQTFNIINVVDNTVSEIEAELLAISEHAYFWFDQGPGSAAPDPDDLEHAANTFDQIYEIIVDQFGSEKKPGIDGDSRLHIVHASPIALCGVTEDTLDQCYLAGLVNSTDLLPDEIDPRSNEREMFVMNARRFGTDFHLGVLAHEFRHMIEDNYDKSDTDWEVEGSATLAAQLVGLPSGGIERANIFLEQPDQQLNSWTEDGTAPYYGQAFLFNRFIYDQLGPDLYQQFATSPLPGFHALDAVLEAAGFDFDGQSLWLNYLAALVIHDQPLAPDRVRFANEGLNTASTEVVPYLLPASYEEQVSQYAADYYELPQGVGSISFWGAPVVSLLGAEPVSGEKYWFAQRANYSNPRLTYSFDLSDLDQATLNYDVYADIEQGYDFAYVSVSVDDGRTWIPLVAEQMQGLLPEDNPSGSALADRFYTGRKQRWSNETIDLTPYVGQEILLRFEYVTDPILTYGGFALDNISIQELGFIDGAEESNEKAFAEGFIPVTANIAQTWHLQHITFKDGEPQIKYLPAASSGEMVLTFEEPTADPSLLIVAAQAPTTLEKASYRLTIEN